MDIYAEILREAIIYLAVAVVFGIIAFFFKQIIKRIGKNENDIKDIKDGYVTKQVHDKEYKELNGEIKKIRENYLTKTEFMQSMAETNRRLDRIEDKNERNLNRCNDKLDTLIKMLADLNKEANKNG